MFKKSIDEINKTVSRMELCLVFHFIVMFIFKFALLSAVIY